MAKADKESKAEETAKETPPAEEAVNFSNYGEIRRKVVAEQRKEKE